jgi:hypothetical protein
MNNQKSMPRRLDKISLGRSDKRVKGVISPMLSSGGWFAGYRASWYLMGGTLELFAKKGSVLE